MDTVSAFSVSEVHTPPKRDLSVYFHGGSTESTVKGEHSIEVEYCRLDLPCTGPGKRA